MALAAGLVRRLGATIEADHASEGGARFAVYLPRPSPAPHAEGRSPDHPGRTEGP
jgi:two-component system sensor histidine kinase BaeS